MGPELAHRVSPWLIYYFFCLLVLRQNCRIEGKKCFNFSGSRHTSSSKGAVAFFIFILNCGNIKFTIIAVALLLGGCCAFGSFT